MKSLTKPLENEDGSAIIVALIITVLLSIAGVTAMNTSNIEITIAGNDIRIKDNFYDAEGAVVEGAMTLEAAEPIQLEYEEPAWANGMGSPDMKDTDNWDYDNTGGDDNSVESSIDDTYYSVVNTGIASGSSLSMVNSSSLHTYAVYGMYSDSSRTNTNLIEVGYKRRY